MSKRLAASLGALLVGALSSIPVASAFHDGDVKPRVPIPITEGMCRGLDTINVISFDYEEPTDGRGSTATAAEAAEGVMALLRGQRDLQKLDPSASREAAEEHARAYDEVFQPLEAIVLPSPVELADGSMEVEIVDSAKGDEVVTGRIRLERQEGATGFVPETIALCTSAVTTLDIDSAREVRR